jgi:nucleoside-diphosphate-sugar epimerase
MDVLVAGGHGQIGLRLLRLLAEGGHRGRGLIRNADHAAVLERAGATAVLCDLEHDDPRPHLGAADAIVFAAGAGPGSGPERKRTVDYGAAVKLMDAARELGVERCLMVSAMGTADVEHASESMRPYLQAKADADAALRESGLDWTIVCPGRLTDVAGTGRVAVSPGLGRYGEVPRDDVALVLLECLGADATVRKQFELLAGDVPAREAVRSL